MQSTTEEKTDRFDPNAGTHTQTCNLSMPADIWKQIDAAVKQRRLNRSTFVRLCVEPHLPKEIGIDASR